MNAFTSGYISTLMFLLLAVPLATSLLAFGCAFLGKQVRATVHKVNIAGATVLLVVAFCVIQQIYTHDAFFVAGKWIYMDNLSAIFLLVLATLGFITSLYSYGYMNIEVEHGEISVKTLCNYYGFFHLFLFTMLIVITTNNLILMWAGIEATTIASAFLVGIYGQNSSLEASWKYIIICTVGVAFGLFGTILIYSGAATSMVAQGLDAANAIFWTEAMQYAGPLDHTMVLIAFAFIIIGFGTKAGFFPMHAWLPDAHSEAASPTSALLSAVLLKCAFLVIIRFYIIVNRSIDSAVPQNLFLVFGFLSIIVAAFFIITQRDLKRKLAYCSVENMGLIAVGIGFGGPIGIFAALIHVINHSLAKGLLFCISGNVLLKYGTRDTSVIKGMLKIMPISGILFAAGALALGGLPPFNVFISEFLVVVAGFASGHIVLTILLLIVLMLVIAGLVSLAANCVLGDAPKELNKGELGLMTVLPTTILLVLMLVMGVCIPKPVVGMLASATRIVMDNDSASLAGIKPDLSSIISSWNDKVEPHTEAIPQLVDEVAAKAVSSQEEM